jgi:dihydrofolate reductase
VIISMIVAMDEKRGIGKAGGLPWRLSSDLKRFRDLTMGHHIVVGRKTFESIGRPLPGRQMIVVTRNQNFQPEGVFVVRSLDAAVSLARDRGERELFICGGAQIYSQALEAANRIYLTQVHADVNADTFFPELDYSDWAEIESSRIPASEKDQFPSTFKVLERVRSRPAGPQVHRS